MVKNKADKVSKLAHSRIRQEFHFHVSARGACIPDLECICKKRRLYLFE